jgi:CxxC-x17-CxxC domain-containing protein
MPDSHIEETLIDPKPETDLESLDDVAIQCTDCAQEFIWTVGEQVFFREKDLQNPPKRCKPCKKAKNRRLDAIETARLSGKRHLIEVSADCARCEQTTTVPFYPSQGRPVYCRACFIEIKSEIAAGANG